MSDKEIKLSNKDNDIYQEIADKIKTGEIILNNKTINKLGLCAILGKIPKIEDLLASNISTSSDEFKETIISDAVMNDMLSKINKEFKELPIVDTTISNALVNTVYQKHIQSSNTDDPINKIKELLNISMFNKLASETLITHTEARRKAGEAFERNGWANPELPVCSFVDKLIEAATLNTILTLAKEGYIIIKPDKSHL